LPISRIRSISKPTNLVCGFESDELIPSKGIQAASVATLIVPGVSVVKLYLVVLETVAFDAAVPSDVKLYFAKSLSYVPSALICLIASLIAPVSWVLSLFRTIAYGSFVGNKLPTNLNWPLNCGESA
jgi:hypothetical protein